MLTDGMNYNKAQPRRRIVINPDIDIVSKLSLDEPGDSYFAREEMLKLKKRAIDSNQETQKKRLNPRYFSEKSLLNVKQENLEKLEVKQMEQRQEKLLKDQIKNFENKKAEYNTLINTINNVSQENYDIDLQVKILDNWNVFIKKKVLLPSTSKKAALKDMIFREVNLRASEQVRRNDKKVQLLEQKEKNKEIIKNIKRKCEEISSEIKKSKKSIEKTRLQLSDHYHLLLYEGLDFRGEGLITLIKNIWSIGMDVDISFMPTYLDTALVDFLFTAAHQTLELAAIKKLVDEEKGKFSVDLDSCHARDSDFFSTRVENQPPKTEAENPFTKKFMEIHKRKGSADERKPTLKEMEVKLKGRKPFPSQIITHFTTLEKIKYIYSKMESKISEARRKEIERITKEFIVNDYGKKFNVGIETILSAICGDADKNSEIVLFTKMEKGYHDDLKKARLYTTYKTDI